MRKLGLFVLLLLFTALPVFAVTPSTTGDGTALATQVVTHPATVKSSAFSMTDKFQVNVSLDHVPIEATAMTNPPVWRVQTSTTTIGSNSWHTLPGCEFTSSVVTADTEILSETEPVGETNIIVPTPGDFAAEVGGGGVFIKNATIANSEWTSVQEQAGQTVVLEDGLLFSQQAAAVMWNEVESWVCIIPPAFQLWRVKYSSEGATCGDSAIRAEYSTFDSVQ